MRLAVRFAAVAALFAAGWAAPSLAAAAYMDMWADAVYGQPDFTHKLPNNPSLGRAGLSTAEGVAVDAAGNLWVADTLNNRVLEFDAPLTTDRLADRVFGQPDFTHNSANYDSVSPNGLYMPFAVALDALGNLYVSDSSNHRVLEYDDPLTSDRAADHVIGQADFTHDAPNRGGAISASGLDLPLGLALDKLGNLYVAEFYNQRVLKFNTPLTSDGVADRVIGQADFSHNTLSAASATTLEYPYGVALDQDGNLYVADSGNERVLEFNTPITSHDSADRVFGQPSFTSDAPNYSGLNAHGLAGPNGLALDAAGNLWVADTSNNRVLEYTSPLTGTTTADRVFGQPSFSTNTHNTGGLSAASLSSPYSVALDAAGDLFVADTSNNRVLAFRSFAFGTNLPLVRR